MMLNETTKMLAAEQRKLIAATRAQIASAIGTGLTAKELIVAEKQLIAETRSSAAFKKMSKASQEQYIIALKQETAQLNASVPGGGGQGGGAMGMMGGKGMMAGMGVMMAAPMLGGAIEQSVGGRGGAAASGALTGAGTGAGMGMMFGPWGAAIGGVIGLLGGLGVSLYATRETFESLVEDAEEVGAALKGNQDAVEAYKKAVTAQNEATAGTKEHIKATREARQSLLAIADPTLRSAVLRTKDNFEELNKEMEKVTKHEQEKQEAIELKALMIEALKKENLSISKEQITKVEIMGEDPGGGNTGTGRFMDVKTKVMSADDIADNAFAIFGEVMRKIANNDKVMPENLKTALSLKGVSAKAEKDDISRSISGLHLSGALKESLASVLADSAQARKVWRQGGMALFESEREAAKKIKDAQDKKDKIENDLLKTRLEEMRAYKRRIIDMRKFNESEKRRTKFNNALVSFQTSLLKKTGQSGTSIAAMTSGAVAGAATQRRGTFSSEFVVAQEKGIKTLIDGLELTAKDDRDFLRNNIFNKLTASLDAYSRGDVPGAITGIRAIPENIQAVQKSGDIEKLRDYANKLEEDFEKQSKNLELELRILGLKDKQNAINAARLEREADVARQLAVMASVSKTGLDARSNTLRAAQAKQSLFFEDPMNLVGMSNVQIAQQKRSDTLGNLDRQQKLERDRQLNKQGQEIVKALAGAEINRLTRDLIDKEVKLIQALKENTAAVRGETPGATPATTTVFSGEQFVVPPKKPAKPAASKVEPNPYAGIGRRNAFNLVSDPADFGPSGAPSPPYTVSPDVAARGTKYLEEIGVSPVGIQGAVGNIFEPTSLQAPTVSEKIEKAITKKKPQGKAAHHH